MRKTFAPNPKNIEKKWHFIDASDRILGQLASEVAILLMGKHKAEFSPNQELGAEKIAVTGKKLTDKVYQHYTGYPGGLRTETLGHLMERRPTEALRRAIKGMLPKNKLLDKRLMNLYIYAGSEHPHKGQEVKKI